MKQVELKPAYAWHCEECGEQNFCTGIVAEFVDDADREELFRSYHGLDDWAELPDNWRQCHFSCVPEEVECKSCGSKFETIDEVAPDELA